MTNGTADVVFVLVRYPNAFVDGGERSTISTASALDADGFHPHFVVTREDALVGELREAGLSHEVVPVGDPVTGFRSASWRERLDRLRRLGASNRAIYTRARASKARIVHAAAITGVLCSWLGAKLAGARFIYHVRDVSRIARTRWYEVAAILLADRTIAISRVLRRSLVSTAPLALRPLLARRIEAVFNGFEFDRLDRVLQAQSRDDVRRALGVPPDELAMLVVGGIFEKKGQLRFIERVVPALARALPALRVTFVGGAKDTAYQQACADAVARLGLADRVRFTGYLPLAEVYRWYRVADLVAVPSAREGLSRAAVEAQAASLPVVATCCNGPEDVIDEGETGYLVSADRVEDMIEPLVRLGRDPALRARLGEAAAVRARARFDISGHVREIERIYGELTG